MRMRRWIVERVGANAANQSGRMRMVVGIVEAPNRRACWDLEYTSLPGTIDATTAVRLTDGGTAHCFNNQHFEYRSFLRAKREDREEAM